MTTNEILRHRLCNQRISSSNFRQAQEVVSYMGAMQAQEYTTAKWSIGLRLPGSNDADIEAAVNDGCILRTHMMRPTWHFVAPADIRWIQQLTAPRVHAFNAFMYRKCELDAAVFKKTNSIIIKMLQGGRAVTRPALKAAFGKSKIITDTVRLSCIMMYAELECIICSGPKEGKQFTYVLLDEHVPATKPKAKSEALAALATHYFSSRWPATIKDFVWWSGLTVKEAKEGIAALGSNFITETIDGNEYIVCEAERMNTKARLPTFLMPDYDEYGISYKNRKAIFNSRNVIPKGASNPVFQRMIIAEGTIAGAWRRSTGNNGIVVETQLFRELNKTQQTAVDKAIKDYIAFCTNKR